MIYTNKINDAIRFATKTHQVYQNQKRKGKEIPYITHPLSVGIILSRAGASEDLIVAGILHDTIEDSVPEKKVTVEMLTERFGGEVAKLVLSVTETNKSLSWQERKHEALLSIESYTNEEVLLKSADFISNITELLNDYEREGDETWSRFNASKEEILAHGRAVAASLLRRWPESPLQNDLEVLGEAIAKIQLTDAGNKYGSRYGYIPKPLNVPSNPELSFFSQNILFTKIGFKNKQLVKGASLYEPELESFSVNDVVMSLKYRNIYCNDEYVVLSYNTETKTYKGEKYKDSIVMGAAESPQTGDRMRSWELFFAQLTLMGLYTGEYCKFEPVQFETNLDSTS